MNIKNIFKIAINSKKKKIFLIGIILISILFSLTSLMFPLLTKQIISSFENQDINIMLIFGAVFFLVLKSLIEGFYEYYISKFGNSIIKDLREYIYNDLINYDMNFYNKHHSGELSSRILNDTEVIKDLVSTHIPQVSSGIVLIIGSFILTLYLDWKLTIAIIIIIPLTFLIMHPLIKNLDTIGDDLQNEKSVFISKTQETFKNIKLVKIFTAESNEITNINRSITNLFKVSLNESKIFSFIGPAINLLLIFSILSIVGYGSYRVTSGELSLSTLIAFVMYIFQLMNPMSSISNFIGEYKKANGSFKSLNNILQNNSRELSGEQKYEFRKNIEFKNIRLSLEGQNILDDISFNLNKGESLTLLGSSGAGKTTILNLIEKFYTPNNGNITIDGVDIKNIDTYDLRQNIGVVSQDSPIISGSILDNLMYGIKDTPMNELHIKDAIQKANLTDLLKNKKDGINTFVGEAGSQLSGGEKQRINIARLLLKDPDIILLDEPTSNLDVKSKKLVLNSIEKLTKDKSVIKITHNIDEITNSQKILFIDKGTIISNGTHQNLMIENKYYSSFITN